MSQKSRTSIQQSLHRRTLESGHLSQLLLVKRVASGCEHLGLQVCRQCARAKSRPDKGDPSCRLAVTLPEQRWSLWRPHLNMPWINTQHKSIAPVLLSGVSLSLPLGVPFLVSWSAHRLMLMHWCEEPEVVRATLVRAEAPSHMRETPARARDLAVARGSEGTDGASLLRRTVAKE